MTSPEAMGKLPDISRRAFLLGLCLGIGMRGDAQHGSNKFLPTNDTYYEIPRFAVTNFNSFPLQRFDKDHLSNLFGILQQETYSTPESRAKAVRGSLRLVAGLGSVARATCFQICESGYYLTAKHVLSGFGTSTIVDPYNGEVSVVNDFIVHPGADVAVLFAPNGRTPRATEGIHIGFDRLNHGQGLWMSGFLPPGVAGPIAYHCIKYGQVDLTDKPQPPLFCSDTAIAVKGMKPQGGTSGSPILDSNGTVVAIESGAYPSFPKKVNANSYTGALVAPLTYASIFPYINNVGTI